MVVIVQHYTKSYSQYKGKYRLLKHKEFILFTAKMANTVVQYNDHIEMHQQMKILCVVFASSSTSNFKALESCHNTPKQCS